MFLIVISQPHEKILSDIQRIMFRVLIGLFCLRKFDGIEIKIAQNFNEYQIAQNPKLKQVIEINALFKQNNRKHDINLKMNQEKVQDYSGIITQVGDIQNGEKDGRIFQFQIIEMHSLDNQHYQKTYQIHLFGKNIRTVFKSGQLFQLSGNYIFLKSFARSHILIGENEILRDKGSQYLNILKFMEQQFKNKQQQKQFYSNQNQLTNFQGIIWRKGNLIRKLINGKINEFRIISFMNIDEQGNLQLYKIKLVGVRAHEKIRISQNILIKNSSIKKIKGQYKILNYANKENVTQIFIGKGIIKQNIERNQFKRFMSQMDTKVDEMNQMLEKMKIGRASKKIKKNF